MTQFLDKSNKFALTTPLYYVNDAPHMGSAYTTLVADAIARFHRLKGEDVLFVTGTDEHGQKIQRTAESRGLEPQVHCDLVVKSFEQLWHDLDIQYDRFSRTSDPRHHAIVKDFFQRVWDNGDIYLDRQQGWYCVACEEFKEKRDLREDGTCALHPNRTAEWRDEENYFFRLSRYQVNLEAHYAAHPDFIQPESRRNEVINFVSQGLQDFSISRVNLDWGFPFPGDPSHTIYVWFDALLGYVTPLLDPEQEPTLDNALSQWWPINLHLIGKDILRFHAVYWPAMLLSARLPLPDRVFGHGFLTKDGHKMSKSLGNILDPFDLVQRYGSDAVRYYFLKEIELGRDGDFNEARFVSLLNADLANDLGNLLNRTLGMVGKYCRGQGPQLTGADLPADSPLPSLARGLDRQLQSDYADLRLSQACDRILTLIRACNKYIDESAPWKQYREGRQALVEQILYGVLESVRFAAYWLSPVIPKIGTEIYRQLGFSLDFNAPHTLQKNAPFAAHSQWGVLSANAQLNKPHPVFVKLEFPPD